MTSKQTADSKNHNPEGHNQHTENSKSAAPGAGQDGKSSASQNQQGGKGSGSPSGQQPGGTHEQPVKAGQQSHKKS